MGFLPMSIFDISEMSQKVLPFVWLGLAILLSVVEAATVTLITIWLAAAALVTMVFAFLGVPLPIQILIFFVASAGFLVATRPLVKRIKNTEGAKTNINALMGGKATITKEFSGTGEWGEVKVAYNGQLWKAIGEDREKLLAVGTQVVVLGVEGIKLIVKPVDQEVKG